MKDRKKKMLKRNDILLILVILSLIGPVLSFNYRKGFDEPQSRIGVRLMFYNVENLFDTLDSDLADDEYLPLSPRRWNSYKYYRKINNIFKVIILGGKDMEPPDLIGLCEVETEGVLDDLCGKTYLAREHYDYIISDGRDERGINTALLYRKGRLEPVTSESWHPVDENNNYMDTRAMLYCRFISRDDTLDIIVCHWPSRRGGAIHSDGRREAVASFLRAKIDSLGRERKIIIMGDFNDEPSSVSLHDVLGAEINISRDDKTRLINTACGEYEGRGSYKYRGTWYLFDQIIISSCLCESGKGFCYVDDSFSIIAPDVLLTDDVSYKGLRPLSTWWGFNYQGGFSDHLPVCADLAYRDD